MYNLHSTHSSENQQRDGGNEEQRRWLKFITAGGSIQFNLISSYSLIEYNFAVKRIRFHCVRFDGCSNCLHLFSGANHFSPLHDLTSLFLCHAVRLVHCGSWTAFYHEAFENFEAKLNASEHIESPFTEPEPTHLKVFSFVLFVE